VELQLQEIAGQDCAYSLDFPGAAIESAQVCDLEGQPIASLEVSGSQVRGEIGARRQQTIRVSFR
jgi:hypothetical protein